MGFPISIWAIKILSNLSTSIFLDTPGVSQTIYRHHDPVANTALSQVDPPVPVA